MIALLMFLTYVKIYLILTRNNDVMMTYQKINMSKKSFSKVSKHTLLQF